MTTATPQHDSLRKIGDDSWKYWLDRDISLRMKFGLPIEHLPDITFAEAQRDADFARTILKRLDAVQPANEEERLTAAILRSSSRRSIDAVPLFWFRFHNAMQKWLVLSAGRLGEVIQRKLWDALHPHVKLVKAVDSS